MVFVQAAVWESVAHSAPRSQLAELGSLKLHLSFPYSLWFHLNFIFFSPSIRTNCTLNLFHTTGIINTACAGWHEHTTQHCMERHHIPSCVILAVLSDHTSFKVKDQNVTVLTFHRSVTFFCPVAGSSVTVLQNSGPCKGAATLQLWKNSVTSQPETRQTTRAHPEGTSTLDIFYSCIGWSAPVAPVA